MIFGVWNESCLPRKDPERSQCWRYLLMINSYFLLGIGFLTVTRLPAIVVFLNILDLITL